MKHLLQHRGYLGSLTVDFDDRNLYGEVQGVNAIVYYEGETVEELIEHFREAVDDYLDWCTQRGKDPCRPVSAEAETPAAA